MQLGFYSLCELRREIWRQIRKKNMNLNWTVCDSKKKRKSQFKLVQSIIQICKLKILQWIGNLCVCTYKVYLMNIHNKKPKGRA